MPSKTKRQQTDPLALLILAYSTAMAVVLLVALDGRPSVLLPIGIAALPFTAPPRHQVAYRVAAAGLMVLLMAMLGWQVGLVFAPAAAGLLFLAYRGQAGTTARRHRVAHR